MKRIHLLVILLIAGLVLTACDEVATNGDDFSAPDEPNILLAYDGITTDGRQSVACWPEGENNVVCDVSDDLSPPTETLNVSDASGLSIVFDGDLEASEILIASQETDANGDPLFSVSLDPSNAANFDIDLPIGVYTLEVTAFYDDVAGSSATVSEIFSVNISDSVASVPTDTPQTEETDIPATDTPEITEAPTDDESDMVINTPAGDDDGADDVDATNTTIADSANAFQTEVAATNTAMAADDTGDETATDEPTDTPIDATDDGLTASQQTTTAIAAEADNSANDAATATAEALIDSATSTRQASLDATGTAENIPPTDTPEPTATFTPSVTPSPTNTPTPEATFTPSPTNTPTREEGLTLRVLGQEYEPTGITVCQPPVDENTEPECESTSANAARLQAGEASAITLLIGGDLPESMAYEFLNAQTFAEVSSGTRASARTYLFNVDVPSTGLYILNVELTYEDGSTISYIYRARIR